MSREIPAKWEPCTNQVDLAVMGKALEEAGELVSAIARCLIQGIDATEPDTGKPNRQWLSEEIADVTALCRLLQDRYDLDVSHIGERAARKHRHKLAWVTMLEDRDR